PDAQVTPKPGIATAIQDLATGHYEIEIRHFALYSSLSHSRRDILPPSSFIPHPSLAVWPLLARLVICQPRHI
ncbi:hypothetical protein NGA88_10675, partial [Streptococcus suis]|uniref:hypothetical protein n=1 Tax=Streptococcus suis TaxID=1307 RepID=UPI00207C77D7